MRYSYAGFGMLLFGVIGLVVIVMFESITLDNDSEYYSLKEAMEASMIESVDWACFRNNSVKMDSEGNVILEDDKPIYVGCNGKLKIVEQKFVENFTRRFAKNVGGDVASYDIEFYDIIESPPKATVKIKSSNKNYSFISDSVDVVNNLTGILEVDNLNY